MASPTIWAWSSTASDNATADSGLTWSEGQAPSTVNDSARMMMTRVADLLKDLGGVSEAGGTANALTLTTNNSFTAYRDGLIVTLRAASTNTGETTLNVNSVGVKPIVKMRPTGEEVLTGGEIQASGIYVVIYSEALNASAGAWLLISPTDTASDLTSLLDGMASKDDPADDDKLLLADSEDDFSFKTFSWSRLKPILKAYFDTLYAPIAFVTDLASTAAGKGASKVGVQDSDGNFTGTTVEAVLAELAALTAQIIGVGQTWQDVTASRSAGTAYRNTTGKPIMVAVAPTNASASVQVSNNGSTWLTLGFGVSGQGFAQMAFIVPNNVYYRITGTSDADYWNELR